MTTQLPTAEMTDTAAAARAAHLAAAAVHARIVARRTGYSTPTIAARWEAGALDRLATDLIGVDQLAAAMPAFTRAKIHGVNAQINGLKLAIFHAKHR